MVYGSLAPKESGIPEVFAKDQDLQVRPVFPAQSFSGM